MQTNIFFPSQRNNSFYRFLISISFLIYLATAAGAQEVVFRIQSPDRLTEAQFKLDKQGKLCYRLTCDKRVILDWSRLGIKTDGPSLDSLISVSVLSQHRVEEKFSWPLGEDATIKNSYRGITFHCRTETGTFELLTRVYNGSLAFRYACYLLPQRPVRLLAELTEFNMTARYRIYQYHEESVFSPVAVDSLKGISDLPSTLVSDVPGYVSIGEADNRNYTKCVLVRGRRPKSLAFHFYIDTIYRNQQVSIRTDSIIMFRDSLVTPWRTVSYSKTAIGLHNFSQLNLKLVKPLNNKVPLGIKPGKVFRVPINTQGALDGVDFASKMNFQYILIDAGWYGSEFRTISDPTKPIPGFELDRIIAHARQKGIGVILYVNYVGLKSKIDTLLSLYKKWGVSGFKFGFVDGGTQKGLAWLDTAMKKVNDNGFVLNVHDHYKPTGLSRRYPFVLSSEGIRGDENSPDAFHTTVLPFTRFLAGAADFTFCYPNKFNSYSKNVKVSKAQQLALTVIYFDPLQAIFWYGRSQDYQNDTEIEFFRYVPTVWDESRYLAGEIGEGISVARRKGSIWYLGSAAGLQPWKGKFRLDFLDKNKRYAATVYEDDGAGGIRSRTINVTYSDTYLVNLSGKSGQAAIITPDR
ncbi:glycoside hydrolase family 97 catalytic domain-containing protein [Mucilaginibacter sp. RCC_168]|uniref:glycoside hydrolase family 97 protein n=1 Tax=unclassified Mucilaginibacter TaxID=2617802 RepID=UPI000883AB09|nr:glycoside hydrolase family 97 protein [Mucilaginibacter sp. OK268]SDP14903.1 alpha-glucosidase [Mucilaginibacter sp. OK268]